MLKQVVLRIILLASFIGGLYIVFNTPPVSGVINLVPLRYTVSSNKHKVAYILADRGLGYSSGSGFVYDGVNGLIVTAAHVVQGSSTIRITLLNGVDQEAELLGMDLKNDVALLRIPNHHILPQVTMGNPKRYYRGDDVFTIGHPHGLRYIVSRGSVSGEIERSLLLDLDINEGNSGGPVFSYSGEVIGMATARRVYRSHYTGISLMIPADVIVKSVNTILSGAIKGNKNP